MLVVLTDEKRTDVLVPAKGEQHFKSAHTRSVRVHVSGAYGNTVIVAKSAGAVPDQAEAKYIAIRNAIAKTE
jgi:hypothetical protein